MTVVGAPSGGQVPVHIGLAEPGTAGAKQPPGYGRRERRLQDRSGLSTGAGIDWPKHGVQPRWIGYESGDCAVALEPGIYHNDGFVEFRRFLAGAASRSETALVVSTLGDAKAPQNRSPLTSWDASVRMQLGDMSIGGPRLLTGSRPQLADGLDAADRDLGLRLLNRPPEAVWWNLRIGIGQSFAGGGAPLPQQVPPGRLHPILVDIHGAPVVAAWIPASEDQRWYILPDGVDWNSVLAWLISHALPTHVPEALRRVRHATFIDLELQTPEETRARRGLSDLEAEYAQRKAVLEQELQTAEERAEPIRSGLLYGTGDDLAAAVSQVLRDAGLAVLDIDDELGATESADLLVTHGSERRLLEVKSAGGSAGEKLVDFLRKHLETWPALRADLPVGGGVLVVNHQYKLPPQERSAAVYERRAFVESLAWPVLSTRQLFDWWSSADWDAVREAVFGSAALVAPVPHTSPPVGSVPDQGEPSRAGKRGWRRGGRSHQ